MYTINMLSKADMIKGQGVLSAHDEQVALVKKYLIGSAEVVENKKRHAEITHYHSINPEYYPFIKGKKKRGTTVGYVHFLPETVETSIHLPKIAKTMFYKYMLSFYKKMDYLVTVNPRFIERLEAYGIDKKKVTYIPNVVSKAHFYPLPYHVRQRIREVYGLSKDKFTIVCAGQLQKRKGVFDFLEIAKMLPQFQFVWAGGFSFGKISDGYEEIKEAMRYLPPNVKFLGLVDREEMNGIYNMADVMFLPSYEELFPMTILEAMNCAVPVLAFALSRKYGKPFVKRMIGDKNYRKYIGWLDKKNGFDYAFAIAIFLPVAPDDLLCFIAGLTKMSCKKFIWIIILGKPGSIFLYSMGLTGAMEVLKKIF